MRRSLLALVVLSSVAAGFAACLSPTQVSVVVTTDVPCAHMRGASISVGRLGGDGGIEDRPASSTKGACDSDGNIGIVVLVPSGKNDEEIAFRVVVGVDRAADACGPNAEGCIVARRALRFLAHEPLTVPVPMRSTCVGVPCTPDTTCVAGKCVAATIADPTTCKGAGCPETQLPTSDAGTPDASSDGAIPDGGVVVSCGDMSGLQAGAPWPMDGYCPAKRRQSPYSGPQALPQPSIKWQSVSHAGYADLSPLIGADGTIYKVSGTTIYAYEPGQGVETTRFAAPETLQRGPAIGVDGTIYAPGSTKLFAVALDGGSTFTSYAARGSLVVGPGPKIFSTDTTSSLVAHNAALGQAWSLKLSGSVDSMSPMLAPGGTLYLASKDGTLFAVPSSDGKGAPLTMLGTTATFQIAFAPDGLLRVSSAMQKWVGAVTTTGMVTWTVPSLDAGSPGDPRPFAVGDDSTVYVPHAQGELVAIRADGSIKWTTTNTPLCNAVTLGADGLVYTGCEAGLFAYSPVDGSVVWSMPMARGLIYAMSIGANHVLYVNASDGVLYAIGN